MSINLQKLDQFCVYPGIVRVNFKTSMKNVILSEEHHEVMLKQIPVLLVLQVLHERGVCGSTIVCVCAPFLICDYDVLGSVNS